MLVAGLGNPGPRYASTRHNVGFEVVDRLAARHGSARFRARFTAETADVEVSTERVLLLKPQTYMNASGRSVAAAMGFYKLEPASLLVVHDELDLPLGTLRLKLGGGDAGHKGIRSVQSELGTPEFARLRVGVGHPRESTLGEAADYVLEAIPPAERLAFEEAVARAAEAVELFLSSGLSVAMNQVNQRMRRC